MNPNHKPIEIVEAELVENQAASMTNSQFSFVQSLLSKRALDAMMLCGGSLLTTGFAVWLWSIGVFANPIVLATVVGAVNLALLGCGLWLLFASDYKFTGRGILLLSSLVLPLNLWLYDSQGLISVADGEPLWIAALIISALYALIARVTRDPLFVYTLVGGVVLTGLLFIAATPGSILLSTLPVTTFLVALGVICVVADTWFLENEGDFGRDKFGIAFFRSGIVVMVTAMAVLAIGQFASATNALSSTIYSEFEFPGIANSLNTKLWVLGNLLTVVATCFCVSCTKRRNIAVSALGVVATVWAAANIFLLLNISITLDLGIVLITAVLITGNLAQELINLKQQDESHFIRSSVISIALLMFSVLRLVSDFAVVEGFAFETVRALQLAASSVAVLTVPGIWTKRQNTGMISIGSAGFALGVMVALLRLDYLTAENALAWSTALPLALSALCAATTGRDISNKIASAVVATVVAIFGVWILLQPFNWPFMFESLPAIATIVVLAISCGVTCLVTGSRSAMLGMLTMVLCVVAQLLTRFDLFNEYLITISVTATGIVLILSRFVSERLFRISGPAAQRIHQVGNTLVLLGSTGAILFAGFEMLFGTPAVNHIGLLCVQLIGLGGAAAMAQEVHWRRIFSITAIVAAIVTILVVGGLSTITIWQKLEIASLALGALMTITGYIGWSREQGVRSDVVTFNLVMGSVLLVLPLMAGLITDRIFVDSVIGTWRYMHEIGGLLVALLLLGSGILSQVRSTTLAGATLLVTFVISNILLIDVPDQLQQTSVLMMIGGGLFFATAVMLKHYRERLMKLPEKIKQGKGVFQVLKWR